MSTNILLNKSAAASDYIIPFTPNQVVNGNATDPKSRWLCRLDGSAWVSVDAGSIYWFNRYVVKFMGNAGWTAQYNMPNFIFQMSNDNSHWTNVDTVGGNSASIVDKTLTATLSARYFRIYFSSGASVNAMLASMLEFEVYDAPAPVSLSALTISSGTLTPAFSSGTLQYTASVGFDVSSITVTPTAGQTGATITVNGTAVTSGSASGPISLNTGDNNITVVVSANGISQTYTIKVTRAHSAYLSNLTAQSGSTAIALSPAPFDKTTTGYTASVGFDVTSITVTPTAEDSSASITVNGSPVTSGQPSAAISLAVGTTTIPVVVTAGGITQNYSIAITKVDTSLTNLQLLGIPGNTPLTLSPGFQSAVTSYTTTTSKGKITVKPTTGATGSTIKVNGTIVASGTASAQITLTGKTTVTITVTSGSITTTYQVVVN